MTDDPDLGRIADALELIAGVLTSHRHEPRRPRQLMNGTDIVYAATVVAAGVALAHLVWIAVADLIRRRRRTP